MNRAELRALLKLDQESFESLWAEFALNNVGSEETISRDFVGFLRDKSLISEVEYTKINAEQNIEIEEGMCFESEGDIPGVELQNLLGEGAMGEVYLARDVALKRSVAFKRIKGKIDKEAHNLFVKEALITAQLEHPSIVPIYSALQINEEEFAYTMKVVRGKELSVIIQDGQEAYDQGKASPVLPVNERLEIFLKVCDAISYSHARKIIHRDLKPENIMLGPFGEVYVMDWGIAHPLEGELNEGEVVGTLSYMSPEQARGELDITAHSDQYALGLILQELITFRKAIPSGTQEDIFRRARRGQTAPIIHYSPKISIRPELVAIIEKATEDDPVDRYVNVEELAEDIRRFLREEPVLAWPDPLMAKVKRWLYRHQTLSVALIALLIIIALGSNLYNVHIQQQSQVQMQAAKEKEEEALRIKEKDTQLRNEHYKAVLIALHNAVVSQSQRIDRMFLGYLNQLNSLSIAAQIVLQQDAPKTQFFRSSDFLNSNKAPKDLVRASSYSSEDKDMMISLDFPVFKLAPGVSTEDVEPQIYQLSQLRDVLRDTILLSKGTEILGLSHEQKVKTLLDEGFPIVWTFVATEEGVHCAYPGKGGYSESYDPRLRPWYAIARGQYGPKCGAPYEDSMGQGLLIPCSHAIYDKEGKLLGVAVVEFAFQFIEQLLELPVFETEDTFLVDEKGEILVSAKANKTTLNNKTLPMKRVVKDIQAGKSSSVIEWSNQGEHMVVYQKIESLGWFYVVVGRTDHLLPQKN